MPNQRPAVTLTRALVRAARGRYRAALKSRYAATGLRAGDDIGRVIERRTGVPYMALVASAAGHPTRNWPVLNWRETA